MYETLQAHPHSNMANVLDYAYSHNKTIVIEEFINGCTLDYQISQRKLYMKEVISIMLQLFSIVSHIHHQCPPIIHRDIKPENILIYQGRVTLIDFEIAKLYQINTCDVLKHGSIGYAAPEQYNGMSNQQSDVYAMGVLLQEIVLASEQRDLILQELTQVIQCSTQWDLKQRYQSIDDMKEAFLRSFCHKKW